MICVAQMTGEVLVSLPARRTVEHKEELSAEERKVFNRVMEFSKRAVEKFMEKSEEKKMGMEGGGSHSLGAGAEGAAGAWTFKQQPNLPGMAGDGEVKAHHILVLLLRLRQICNHVGLIKSILAEEEKEADGLEGDADLVSAMEDLGMEEKGGQEVDEVLNMANPIFDTAKSSTKIDIIVEEVRKLVVKRQEEGVVEKAIIVSQWTSMLTVMKQDLGKLGIKFAEINGNVAVKLRGDIVTEFNTNPRGAQVRSACASAFVRARAHAHAHARPGDAAESGRGRRRAQPGGGQPPLPGGLPLEPAGSWLLVLLVILMPTLVIRILLIMILLLILVTNPALSWRRRRATGSTGSARRRRSPSTGAAWLVLHLKTFLKSVVLTLLQVHHEGHCGGEDHAAPGEEAEAGGRRADRRQEDGLQQAHHGRANQPLHLELASLSAVLAVQLSSVRVFSVSAVLKPDSLIKLP